MPIRSMTGYGEHSTITEHWEICVRLKTLNHRHLDARISGLDRYPMMHLKVRERLQKTFSRGRVDLEVEVRRARQAPSLQFDGVLARRYLEDLRRISRDLDLDEQPSLEFVLGMEGVTERVFLEEEGLWDTVAETLDQAVEQAQTMRAHEGERLEKELTHFVDQLKRLTQEVEARTPEIKEAVRQRLLERITALNEDIKLDQDRIEEEVILYVERGDISEEVARLYSHFEAGVGTLSADEPAGKRLDFIAQEMGREINTIGAKAKDATISHQVIEMKSVLEKFREQVRNIE